VDAIPLTVATVHSLGELLSSPAAMTTRTERRRQQTHDILLDALHSTITESGLAATTVAEVAERADVAIGTFYNHFEGRDEAITELADRLGTEIRDIIDSLIEGVESMVEALDLLTIGFLDRLYGEPAWGRFMVEVGTTPAWPRKHLSLALSRLVAEGQRRGEFSDGDSYERGYLVGSVIRGVIDLHLDPERPRVSEEMLLPVVRAAAGAPLIAD